jgi:hypothetical protein
LAPSQFRQVMKKIPNSGGNIFGTIKLNNSRLRR